MVGFRVSTGFYGVQTAFTGGGRTYDAADPAWTYGFSRFANFMQDWGPAWDQIVESFRRAMDQQFASEGQYLSGGWKELTPLYYFWKEERYPGQPILSLTGALRRAAITPAVRKSPKSLSIAIDDPKYWWHQAGTSRMKARPIIQFPPHLQAEWTNIFLVALAQYARKSWT